MTIFTLAERTIKKHTIDQAVAQAKMVLKLGHNVYHTSIDTVKEMNRGVLNTLITTEEMSIIVQNIVHDTLYWER